MITPVTHGGFKEEEKPSVRKLINFSVGKKLLVIYVLPTKDFVLFR